ncbi:MAG: alpha/beta hydrolase [Chloroflexota bacterium]
MSAITIENDLVHYEVLGRGRPVIFVHGWLGSWRYWVPTMQQLSVKYRTYALDLWGFGDSGKDKDHYGFKDQVQLLHDFMDKLGIAKAALVGHSLGAAVCLRFASQYPDRAPRVALISPPLFDLGGLEDGANGVARLAGSGTVLAPAPQPSQPTNTDTIPRNPFRGMGDTPEEILARLQAKNVISAAGLGGSTPAAPPKPVAPSTPALPTGIGTPILPKTATPAPAPTTPTTPPAAAATPASTTPAAAPAAPAPAPVTITPAAVPAATPIPARTDQPNPLLKFMNGKPIDLLNKYIDRDMPDADKLRAEVEKTDEIAISKSVLSFNGVNLALELQRLVVPVLLVHGKADPVLAAPTSQLLMRINKGKPTGNLLDFVDEPDLRHFPMLEINAKFNRLLMDFLEAVDLTNVQFKDQWRRTLR